MKRVEVEWRDSMSQEGWHDRDELERSIIKDDYLNCRSVGLLFAESDTYITLVLSEHGGGEVCDAMTIPREAIVKIRTLK